MPKVLKNLFKVDLQLFNDGGATGGAEGSAAATESAPKADIKANGSSRRSKAGEFDNVVFGKQEGTTSDGATTSLDTEGEPMGAGKTDVTTTSDTLEARRKAFEDLINGEYKDLYHEKFQKTFDRRFKEVKALESELESQKPIMERLKARYNVEDTADLDKAITEDYEMWESVAEANGQTVEQYLSELNKSMAMRNLERENAELKAMRRREIGQMQMQKQLDTWYAEGEKVKELYPSFDFKTEAQNSEFLQLLKSGVGVEHAYKTLHFDELTQNAARVAAQTADAQAQARIKQRASRPSENGTSSKSAVIVKNDVSNLTRAERAEIARRVARGEKISF